MTEGIKSNEALKTKEGADFWRYWELLHLGGRLVNFTKLRELVTQEYEMAKKYDPEFSLEGERELLREIKSATL
ncbi:MAG: hypothetical protein C0603_09950 [Denitrovibrio sp.]|nr:MAG: hypothetical protein C0603_09950 [Denitrovibrio sp.]